MLAQPLVDRRERRHAGGVARRELEGLRVAGLGVRPVLALGVDVAQVLVDLRDVRQDRDGFRPARVRRPVAQHHQPGQHHGVRLDEDEGGTPSGPQPGQPDPEDAIPAAEPGSVGVSVKDGELLTEGEVLREEGDVPAAEISLAGHSTREGGAPGHAPEAALQPLEARAGVEERLERLKGRREAADVAAEIMRISLRCRALPEIDPRSADEVLGYDEGGLPQ